ncbi:MAG: AI-2E family transporter [Saprospiraceae bacterium]|uniref:AI-2E family transporter n=1 Tax=Candidatus Opimibacter skivensis TaxID=2982028 RepID=A0A9D7XS49_9BACT|nr:AI-2E family transporter [Candidatus Opimibacter skivensis]
MEELYIPQNRIRQIFFLLCLLLLGVLLARELSVFVPGFLGAITLYIIMRKVMLYLVMIKHWPKPLAAALLMLLSLIVIMIPIGGLVSMMSSKVTYAIQHSDELVGALQTLITRVEGQLGYELISQENISSLGNFVARTTQQLLSATFNTLATLFFMYFILYFMLVNGRKMEHDIYEYIPLKNTNVNMLGYEVHNMVISNAIGIPVIAFLQGIVALIGYLIIGVKEPWFWFVITCFTAMLPVIGAAFAYVPLAIIFFANDQIWQGVFMLIYGFGVIGLVDNVLRFTIARKIGNVHPLITVFGVIIGINLFGFIGLIFGPLLISLFILLLKIYSSEFIVKQREIST